MVSSPPPLHLHELEGPDGCEEMLLGLVAGGVLLQSLRALSELRDLFQQIEVKILIYHPLKFGFSFEYCLDKF